MGVSRKGVAYRVDSRMKISIEASKVRVDRKVATGKRVSRVVANDPEEKSLYRGADRTVNKARTKSSKNRLVGKNPGSYSRGTRYVRVVDRPNKSSPNNVVPNTKIESVVVSSRSILVHIAREVGNAPNPPRSHLPRPSWNWSSIASNISSNRVYRPNPVRTNYTKHLFLHKSTTPTNHYRHHIHRCLAS